MAPTAPVVLRRCSLCRESKPYREFHTKVDGKHSMNAWCKSCDRATTSRAKELDPLKAREGNLKSKYGITLADYEDMLTSQSCMCAICERPERAGKFLSVDHCHDTGRVRGLLCTECNTGLGKLGDTVESLRAALAYLEA